MMLCQWCLRVDSLNNKTMSISIFLQSNRLNSEGKYKTISFEFLRTIISEHVKENFESFTPNSVEHWKSFLGNLLGNLFFGNVYIPEK